MSLPEIPGKELVGSVDIALRETVHSHHSANCSLEDFLECTRLGNLEESVDGVLDMLDEVNLSNGCGDSVSNRFSLSDEFVEDRLGDPDDMTTDLLDDLSSFGSGFLYGAPRFFGSSFNCSSDVSGSPFDPSRKSSKELGISLDGQVFGGK